MQAESQAELEALAQGDLAQTPFSHLLLYMYGKRFSGTLVISPPSNGARIGLRVHHGKTIAGQIPMGGDSLEAGLLPLCAMENGVFAFYGQDLLANAEGLLEGEIDPYGFISRSIRKHCRDNIVDEVLERFGDTKLRVQPQRDIGRLDLLDDQKIVLDLLRAEPADVASVIADAPMDERDARRTLYLFAVTRIIDPMTAVDEEAFRSHTRQTLRDAEPDDAPKSGTGETKSFEVEGANRPAWKQLVGLQGTLSGVKAPGASGATIPGRNRSPRTTMDDQNPKQRFKVAAQVAERGDYGAALTLVNLLLAKDPMDPKCLGLKTLCLFHQADYADEVPREVLECLKLTLELDPEEGRALYTKGLIHKEKGQLRKAHAAFADAAKAEPTRIEYKREAHMIERLLKG